MTMKRKIQILLLAIVLCVSCFLTCFAPTMNVCYALGIDVVGSYSTALEDLQTDKSFNDAKYPVVENDYSLSVIQVAESVDNQLLVYVYQPNEEHGKYVASTINISLTIGENLSYKNYKLELLNCDGVFQKYVVKGLVVSSNTTRYYDISSIYRKFDEEIDPKLDDDNENTIDEVVYKVAKRFYVATSENGVEYSTKDIDVVTITDKYVGFIRYQENSWDFDYLTEECDSHFVAFSTDKKIENLLEADVYYLKTFNQWVIAGGESTQTSSTPTEEYAYLDYKQVGKWSQNGLFAMSYKWDRIQSVTEFITDPDLVLTDEGRQDVLGKDWVLRFTETPYKFAYDMYDGIMYQSDYSVSEVTILRLKFETNGVTYNLGVIDNKQTGDGIPDGRGITFWEKLWQQLRVFLLILLLILLVIIFAPILPTIFNILWWLIKTIIKIAWWLLCLPFKLIKAIFKKRE